MIDDAGNQQSRKGIEHTDLCCPFSGICLSCSCCQGADTGHIEADGKDESQSLCFGEVGGQDFRNARCGGAGNLRAESRADQAAAGYETHKRGLDTRIHLAVDSSGMPVRAIITEGARADCREAVRLIEGIAAQKLLADRGYDTSEIVAFAL